jgi:2-methylcitrate dehydratase PrpD
MESRNMHETLTVARYAAGVHFDALPVNVVACAKRLLLDQLACQIGVSQKPWLRPAVSYVDSVGGKPESTVVSSPNKSSAENAAFVNGSFGHGFEIDDAYPPGLLHPGAVIVAAALAVAERDGCSGRDLLRAIVLGYDVMGRVGQSLSPSQLSRGFHPTSAAGPIGAAVAAGSLMGLNSEQMTNALAISASSCGGLTECYKSGGEIKRYHAGTAAAAGVRAAGLARLGLTGPSTILEGPLGIRAMTDTFTPGALTEGLGEWFLVERVWIKKYCCNGMLHAPLDALEAIVARRPVVPEQVQGIVVGSNRHAPHEVGSIRVPKDMFGLQFSMGYTIAMRLVFGDVGLQRYSEQTLVHSEIADLAGRVTVEVDPVVDGYFPSKIGGRVSILFVDGTSDEETIEDCRGTPNNPMSPEEMRVKVQEVAGLVMNVRSVDRLIELVDQLDSMRDVHLLCELLTLPNRTGVGKIADQKDLPR